MFRLFFLMLSKAVWAQKAIIWWDVTRRTSRRFVAGETLEEAVDAIWKLNQAGILATLDHLGENTTTLQEANAATQSILEAIQSIQESHLRANISIKLSQIGLNLEGDICQINLGAIISKADSLGIFVRIDMEDSLVTEKTLSLHNWALEQGFKNVGIVLQAYLYRTEKDMEGVLKCNGRVRLCKGAYKEPENIAYPRKADVDRAFDQLAETLILKMQGCPQLGSSLDGHIPPTAVLATHDIQRINFARSFAQKNGIPNEAIEFQMLYGIRRDHQEMLVKEGFPVRIYVPYGTQWYPYFMRRLAERPANVWFFISNFFR